MAFVRSADEVAEQINVTAFSLIKVRAEYIERMAAAYLRTTDINPREVELVEKHSTDGIISWYFRKKGSNE